MIRFIRYRWLYFLISGIAIIPGIFSLLTWGLKPSIDFTGGTLLELKFKQDIKIQKYEDIRKMLKKKGVETASIQPSGKGMIIIRTKPIFKNETEVIKTTVGKGFKENPQEIRFETVGPILGKELINKTIVGILVASGFILFYVGSRFKEKVYGTCAIIAMFHDSLVLLGIFSLLGHFYNIEVDTLFVTALLTILSFSVHDTVVVYDRIRENQKNFQKQNFEDLANKAITSTLTRSLNNSLTIIFMLLALFLLGGQTIKWFILALLIGTVSGTYSSTFNAVPLLFLWKNYKKKA